MDKKLLIHICILLVLAGITFLTWSANNPDTKEPPKTAQEEEYYDEDDDPWADTQVKKETKDEAGALFATAIPLFLTMGYAAFLVITYILPSFVDSMSEEMYGSTAVVEDDPMHDARTAFAQGEYPEAIRIYRSVWNDNKDDRFPIVEIAKIQRDNLKSPAVAVETLREALESKEWRENDAAFFMFRIADIYENDMNHHEGCVSILQQVISDLPDTRHSANATHKLRELGEI